MLIVAALIALGYGATADDQQHADDKGQTQEVKEVNVPAYTVDELVKMGRSARRCSRRTRVIVWSARATISATSPRPMYLLRTRPS